MIPSFAPIHDYFRTAIKSGLPNTLTDPETGLAEYTLDQLADNPDNANWRFVDGPQIDYLGLVSCEKAYAGLINSSPLTSDTKPINWTATGPTINSLPKTPTVAVIGAGMAGLMTALQLRKAGMAVTVYEAYGSPTSATSKAVPGAITSVGHAGRVFPVDIVDTDDTTESQLGCMRFPTGSSLFWWYLRASKAASEQQTFTQFPNPAQVPSSFTGYSGLNAIDGGTCDPIWTNAPVWPSGGVQSPYQLPTTPYNYPALNAKHMNCFLIYVPKDANGNAVGTDTLQSIGQLLAARDPDPTIAAAQLARITAFWNAAIAELYNVSYEGFLKKMSFSDEERDRIGSVGFGTGGFHPLFNVGVLDIMRIVLWNYSSEMAVPDLGMYPTQLSKVFSKAYTRAVGGVKDPHYDTPVTAVAYLPTSQSYYVRTASGNATYDYVVLAMTHTAAGSLLGVSSHTTDLPTGAIVPYADGSLSSDISNDLQYQNIMKTTKIFHLIKGPKSVAGSKWTTITAINPGDKLARGYDHHLRALYGAFDTSTAGSVPLGVTYLQPLIGQQLKGSSQINALHYSWGYGTDTTSDADQAYSLLASDTNARASMIRSGCYRGVAGTGTSAIGTLIRNATSRRFSNFTWRGMSGASSDLLQFFTSSKTDAQAADLIAVYWHNVPYVLGAFKLDAPSHGAHLTFAYKVLSESRPSGASDAWWDSQQIDANGKPYYSVNPAARGLFFAGDSFSNYGGWVEGAFQSALATSAGIVKQAHIARWGVSSGGSIGSSVKSDKGAKKGGVSTVSTTLPFYNAKAIDALVTNARDPYGYVGR